VDYRLVAPFDGVITHIDYKVGDNLLDTGDTEFLTVENPGNIIVTIPLDQVDVVHVKTGMTASIAFDAIPGQKFQGTLYQIDSTAITTSGVVSYNVSVKLPTPPDLTILSGMTATVNIETSRKDNVLVVPNLALQTTRGQKTVQRADGQTVTVQTGVTDGQMTEIVSGLAEGDGILSINLPRTTGASSSANANAAQQLLRGAGGFGGGGGRPGG
jgi:RND family efflux transporter MFP subunit